MSSTNHLPIFIILAICACVGDLSAATPPDHNAEACYEKITCKQAFEDALKAKPPVDLSQLFFDPDPLDPNSPLVLIKDKKCRPEPNKSARGVRVTLGWFPSSAQCGRVWEKKTGNAAAATWKRTDFPCGAWEVDIEKKKTCVAAE